MFSVVEEFVGMNEPLLALCRILPPGWVASTSKNCPQSRKMPAITPPCCSRSRAVTGHAVYPWLKESAFAGNQAWVVLLRFLLLVLEKMKAQAY